MVGDFASMLDYRIEALLGFHMGFWIMEGSVKGPVHY